MLGENNNNNTLPVFLNKNAFQYPTNTSNQLQLFGNSTVPVGFNVNPTNYFGGEHNTALVRPNKRVKDAENIPMQQKLQISLNNNVGLDEAYPPVRVSATHNPVSTGLRLSYDDDERNSSVTSSGSMNASSSVMLSLTDDFKTELDNQKREFDQYLKTQEETLTKGLREIKRRHMASFLGAMQKGISNKLHEKDVELENINRKNKELVDRIKQTASEAQNWCYRAKYNESVATMLKTNIQRAMHSADQAKEGFGDSEMDDATSGGVHPKFGLSVGAGGGGSPAKPPPQQAKELLICKGCKSKEHHSHSAIAALLQISWEPPNHCSLRRRAMSGASEKALITTVTRRVASVANHLLPPQPPPCSSLPSIGSSICSSSINDTYHRVHGEVPAHVPAWRLVPSDDSGKDFTDIIYEKAVGEAIAKITINRPERRNAFRPHTVKELIRAFNDARDDGSVGVIILTGKGTKAFCSGGDQALRNKDGYVDYESFGRLNVLDLQVQIRRLPKPVIAMVAGYAVGGGHVLHMVCDLTIAADNAIFGQTGPKVGSFDAGYGSSIMSRLVGPKKAREMWFLTRFYTASEAEKMGLVNTVVPLENLEQETIKWCREILRNSPTAIRVLKSALNAVDDGHAGLQGLGGDATLLFYGTDEGNEGKNAYVQRRPPNFSKFPRLP